MFCVFQSKRCVNNVNTDPENKAWLLFLLKLNGVGRLAASGVKMKVPGVLHLIYRVEKCHCCPQMKGW